MQLSDLYSATYRATHPEAMALAAIVRIPHPLNNVEYADGVSECTHAKKHKPGQACRQVPRKNRVTHPTGALPEHLRPRQQPGLIDTNGQKESNA